MDGSVIFDQMDKDMNAGWTLDNVYMEHPNQYQKCLVAANRLLTAIHADNTASQELMAAYLLNRMPEVGSVDMNMEGEAMETLFYDTHHAVIDPASYCAK